VKQDEIKATVFRILRSIAPDTSPEQLGPDDNIRRTLGIDSFDYLQFIIALDEAIDIQTAEEDYGKIETLSALLDYISAKKSSARLSQG